LALRGQRFVAAHDFPAAIVGEQWLVRDAGLTYAEIAAADGVVSLAAVGIAQTGTIILDAGVGQGRRVITLLPDFHLCIVQASQIVVDVPTAMRAVAPAVHERRAPLTLISGPSATSDIELNRVEGVHGPRQLEVLIVE
jgi:L-lactate dehydrogenase complex protein LldG